MERLTYRDENGKAWANIKNNYTAREAQEFGRIALEQLAAYEDSGLSPKEVQELAKAKVEGRLLVPPVQVGDKIYNIGYSMTFGKKMIFTHTVSEVMYFSKRGERPWLFETYGGLRFDNLDIGEIVFLTYEEAKQALERSGQDGSR